MSLLKKNETQVRVIYADTDAMGIVYHTNYIKWFEIGRTELLREMEVVYAEVESSGYYLPVTEAYCHYLLPARYDDILVVQTVISNVRRASIQFDYQIRNGGNGKILAKGFTIHAFVNRKGTIVRVPRDIMEKIRKWEESTSGE